MKNLALLALFVVSIIVRSASEQCEIQNYIIPYEVLNPEFELITNQQKLNKLIQQPSGESVQNYLLSIAPYAAPLFTMAGLVLIIFIATITQVICFNTCSKECCGNQISSSTYNVCCIRCMTITFIVCSFLLGILCIAALIVNSDLQKSIDSTSCNTFNILNQTYDGNDNSSIPWSGVKNFQTKINKFSVNIQNVVPDLQQYINNSDEYKAVINTTAGSLFNLSQMYECQNSTSSISCPFGQTTNCPTDYKPTFSVKWCDTNYTGSSSNLINNQMTINSSSWRKNIINMNKTVTALNVNRTQSQKLAQSVTSFTRSFLDYEEDLRNGIDSAEDISYLIEIALYVFYGFILLLNVLGVMSVCCTYYCNNFGCKNFMYIYWYAYFLTGFALFILSGFFLSGTVFVKNVCSAYPYYFDNQTHFKQLNFANSKAGNIFETCYYTHSQSIFEGFTDAIILNQFKDLRVQYQAAKPDLQFRTVVTDIENTLNSYIANPNTVKIFNVSDSQQPQAALNTMNTLTNFSSNPSKQTCNVIKDYETFNAQNCYPYIINQPVGENSCIVINQNLNISDMITNRTNAFKSKSGSSCNTEGDTYKLNMDALLSYSTSISSMVEQLAPEATNFTNPLQKYQTNYFNYYSQVSNFFNSRLVSEFDSIFSLYSSLQDASSCGFIKTSLDGITNIACNQVFPYFKTLTVLNIICPILSLMLFLLSYFLTVRYQFYQFLQGNFDNFGLETTKTEELAGYTADQSRNNNRIELLTPTENVGY